MSQAALFHETIYDAIGADISAAGGFKVVAAKLWPSESPTTAANKLRNSINPDQPHKLCADEVTQIKRLAREAGSDATVQYEAMQLGYRIEWVNPQDEAEQLRRELRDLLTTVNRKLDLVEKAEQRTSLRSVQK